MARSILLTGPKVRIYIAGKLYPEVRSISYTINYGEQEIYGIDSPYPQEIRTTRVSVQGSISGVRVQYDGGTQGALARPRINEILQGPYVAIRVQDLATQQDIFFCPQAKVTSEQMSIAAKGVAILSFSFKGVIPYQEIDLA